MDADRIADRIAGEPHVGLKEIAAEVLLVASLLDDRALGNKGLVASVREVLKEVSGK